MGLRYRKSFKMGPFRVNLSKSGVSTSVGVKGYRVTKRADGKVQTTASIPGTGVSHVTVHNDTEKSSQPQKKEFLDTFFGKLVTLCAIFGIAWLVLMLLAGCSSNTVPAEDDAAPAIVEEQAKDAAPVEEVMEPDPEPEIIEVEDLEPAPAEAEEPEPEPEPEPEAEPEPETPAAVVVTQPVTQPEPEPAPVVEQKTVSVIGNKNTKKYHELWCSSINKMKDSNKVSIESAEAAEAAGYVPCKNCH